MSNLLPNSKSLILCLIIAISSLQLIFALNEIEVYRIIGYEEHENL